MYFGNQKTWSGHVSRGKTYLFSQQDRTEISTMSPGLGLGGNSNHVPATNSDMLTEAVNLRNVYLESPSDPN